MSAAGCVLRAWCCVLPAACCLLPAGYSCTAVRIYRFVRVCFTTLVTSVIVEALFSQYDAMKGKGNKSR
eukprot:COSAG06_NODE_36202_length_450_cov_0.937322_1_plen_68_part_10